MGSNKRRVKFGGEKNMGTISGKIDRAAKREGIIRSRPPVVTSQMVPAEPVAVSNPERELHLRRLVGRFSGDLTRKALKVRYLALVAPGPNRMKPREAWKALHPRTKATPKSCGEKASDLYSEILKDLGPDPDPADILALCGIHVGSIGEDLAAARGANFVREFYDHKAGVILTGKERPDHLVRLRAVELSMKAIGLGRDKESGSGPIIVNVVSYCGPNTAPWPNGGRADAQGIMRPTIGPGAIAALPAGSLGEPRDGA
jgi:hypothetical protein